MAMAMIDGDSREFQVLLAYLDDMFGDTSEYERMARCLAAPTRRAQDETLSFLAARVEAAMETAKRTVAEQDAKVQYSAAPRTTSEITKIYKEVAAEPTQSVPDVLPATTMTSERMGAMGHASTSRTQKVDGRSSPRGESRENRKL